MRNYIDIKVTAWKRIYLQEGSDLNKIISELEKGAEPFELEEFDEYTDVEIPDELMSLEENDNFETIEVYQNTEENWDEKIWDNKNKFNQDGKTSM